MANVSTLRANARLAAFAAYSTAALGAYEAALAVTPEARRLDLLYTSKRVIASSVLRILGVMPSVNGRVSIARRPRLVVANHRAALDIGVLLTRITGHFLSRGDLAKWPVVGRMAQRAETIFVDRASEHSGASAIRAIRRKLKAGRTVMVFPEGATFRGDEVQPFRPGAFSALRGLDAEILPVGLAYPPGTEYVDVDFVTHVRSVAARRKTPVAVTIGEPIAAEGNSRELAAEAHARVQELVRRSRRTL
ncbi:MAG: lysophospholipid acyltransferase family protein [Myxococcota bacterium]